MTETRAHIEDDWQRNGIGIGLTRRYPDGTREVLAWSAQPERRINQQVADEFGIRPDPVALLFLDNDYARALYEALADHFGHGSNDVRALRRDYDSERARVDRFIGTVLDIAARPPAPMVLRGDLP